MIQSYTEKVCELTGNVEHFAQIIGALFNIELIGQANQEILLGELGIILLGEAITHIQARLDERPENQLQ